MPCLAAVLLSATSRLPYATPLGASGVKQSLYPIDALNVADVIQQRIEAYDVLNIEAYRTLEDAVVRMDVHRTHIYAEVGCYKSR